MGNMLKHGDGRDPIAEFVQDVQDSFTVLALPDEKIASLFKEGEAVWPSSTRALVFEILSWDDKPASLGGQRIFMPYISRRLDELYRQKKAERSAQKRLAKNKETMSIGQAEQLEGHSVSELLEYYRASKVSTDTAASAVVCLGWETGFFYRATPDRVREAFFIEGEEGDSAKDLVAKMAKNMGASSLAEKKELPDGRKWRESADETGQLAWIEYSLIHRLLYTQVVNKWRLVHYPLIIDHYWFVGFAYFLGDSSQVEAGVEVLSKEKYNKCRVLLTNLVAEPLRDALYRVAIDRLEKQGYLNSRTPLQEVYLLLLRSLFPCLGFQSPESDAGGDELRKPLTEIQGVKVYGPSWIRQEPKVLGSLEEELRARYKNLTSEIEKGTERDELIRRDEAQRLIEFWAHSMQHKLRPASIWADRLLSGSRSQPASSSEAMALSAHLVVLEKATQTLSKYWRIEDYLKKNGTSISKEKAQNGLLATGDLTRSFGYVLFEALLMMVVRLIGKDSSFSEAYKMEKFVEKGSQWLSSAQGLWRDLKERAAYNVCISDFSELIGEDEFRLIISDDVDLKQLRVWGEFPIDGAVADSDFRVDIVIGMVLDNMLSNACKYVRSPGNGRDKEVKVSVLRDHMAEDFGLVSLVVEVSNTANIDITKKSSEQDFDLLNDVDSKAYGLRFCRDVAKLLAGNPEDFSARISEDGLSVIARFRFPVVVD